MDRSSHGLLGRGSLAAAALGAALAGGSTQAAEQPQVHYRTHQVDGLEIFYREAGPADAPTILMLHGFPTSSHMYRDLLPLLARRYHVIAPDYPGYGYSDAPAHTEFAYTFDHLTDVMEQLTEEIGVTRYSLLLQDFGGPVGFRLAARHPDRVQALLVQNAVAYEEGLSPDGFAAARAYWADRNPETEAGMRSVLTLEATRFGYLHGAGDPSLISPDSWSHAQAILDRPGNAEIQLDLFYDYRTNLGQYPLWQAYFREHQPPTLVVWGRNDPYFTVAGAEAFRRDLPQAELHLLEAGHFAIEERAPEIGGLIEDFLARALPAD
jgi:pimeloyl-ACP methyl ester carboxylesterase